MFLLLIIFEIENNDVKNELASENIDKSKSILGAPSKLDKKEIKNPRAKKGNTKKPKQKKTAFLSSLCGVTGHPQPNCYKWLATQQSNNMISLGTIISFHHLLLLLEIFSKPSCSFQTWTVSILLPHRRINGLQNGKVLLRCGRKKAPSDLVTFSLSSLSCFWVALLVCFYCLVLSQSSFMPCFV